MGGCLLNENLTWGSVLFAFNAFPPDPELVGPRWREMWRERLEHAVLFPEVWMRHPRRDAYWRHGSVCEDFGAIGCPVYAIGGWADAYSNAVPRLLAGLRVPRKGLVGPWGHLFPNEGVPGPAIGFLQEAIRWWDQWLAGRDSGVLVEPAYRVWMQDGVPPLSFHAERPGHWVAETGWPSPRIETRRLCFGLGRLAERVEGGSALELRSPQTTGLAAGDWCAFGSEGEMPIDQRSEDGKSLCFDGDPLEQGLEILGAPLVSLELSLDRPAGLVAVRLEDVAPDGASARVSYGLLNLTHRSGHERPEPLVPGERYRVAVELKHIAHAFPPGHCVRVAVSTSYWPLVWPAPEPFTLTLHTGGSRLELPVRPPRAEDAGLAPFGPPERAAVQAPTPLREAALRRSFERDLARNETVYTIASDGGPGAASLERLDAIDLEVGHRMLRRYRIGDDDPLSARAEVEFSASFRRRDWSIRVECRTQLSATAGHFQLEAALDAYESEEKVFSRAWHRAIPRDGV
jgi:predicted acyl esterase